MSRRLPSYFNRVKNRLRNNRIARHAGPNGARATGGMTMKWHEIGSRALVALGALIAVTGTALAVESPTGELMGRVESVRPGGRAFTVTDQDGNRIQVARPARPPQAASLERDGDLVNATALHEGDTVLIAGARHGDWIEARRVELLSGARIGAATTTARVLRLTGSVNGRQLTAVDPNGAEYRILFLPRPQMVSVWKAGNLVDLSALREGDRVIPYGTEQGHLIRADRLEVLDESHVGGGAAVPLRLTLSRHCGMAAPHRRGRGRLPVYRAATAPAPGCLPRAAGHAGGSVDAAAGRHDGGARRHPRRRDPGKRGERPLSLLWETRAGGRLPGACHLHV
jgi:hypothetical protein